MVSIVGFMILSAVSFAVICQMENEGFGEDAEPFHCMLILFAIHQQHIKLFQLFKILLCKKATDGGSSLCVPVV